MTFTLPVNFNQHQVQRKIFEILIYGNHQSRSSIVNSVDHTECIPRWFITVLFCFSMSWVGPFSAVAIAWLTTHLSCRCDILLLLFDIAKRPTGKLRIESTRGQAEPIDDGVENLQQFLTGKSFEVPCSTELRPLLINEAWFIFDKSKVWEWVWCLKDWKRKMWSFDNWKRGDSEYWYRGHWYRLSIDWIHPSLIFMLRAAHKDCSFEQLTERVKHKSWSKYDLSMKHKDFVAHGLHLNSKHV